MVDLGELTVRTAPVLFTYAAEPDAAAVVRPLLSREAQRLWGNYESALRDADDEVYRRMTEGPSAAMVRSARHPICGLDVTAPDPIVPPETPPKEHAPKRTVTERAAELAKALVKELESALATDKGAALVALGYLAENGATTADAAAFYRRAKEKAPLDSPVGWVARDRLAAVDPSDAAAENDALLGGDLTNAQTRAWTRSLLARPLPDYVKAAGVMRAIALSAKEPRERTGARTEWMIAAYDAGNWREALDVALMLLREAQPPHAALDVAVLAREHLPQLERATFDLPPAASAALRQHTLEIALRDGDPAKDPRARAMRLARRCLAHPRDAGDPGAEGTRIDVTVTTFPDRAPETKVAAVGSATTLTPGIACLEAQGARYFRDADASAHFVIVDTR